MDKMVNQSMMNQLLKQLGYSNLMVSHNPSFYWNGNDITDDNTAAYQTTRTYKLKDNTTLLDFLDEYKDKKIVLAAFPDGNLMNKLFESNLIRAFIN